LSWYVLYDRPDRRLKAYQDEIELLASLYFDEMEVRQQPKKNNVLDETCRWILESPYFNFWLRGKDEFAQPGLLWIKGKLGSGKSTLMKEASRLLKEQFPDGNSKIASFFFASHRRTGPDSTLTSHGKIDLDSTPLSLFRSLLYQLLPGFPTECLTLIGTYQRKLIHQSKVQWSLQELQDTFMGIFSKPQLECTFIFVDGIDECEDTIARDLVRFFRRATVEAHRDGAKLNICFSSRNTFTVTNPLGATIPLCHEIALEDNNSVDITRYVSQSLRLGNPSEESGNSAKWNALGQEVVERSSGVFLWVVLVVKLLQNSWEDGRDIGYLRHRLMQVPVQLEELYVELIKTIAPSEVSTVLHILQWVLLSTRPLELSEWHHVMAFIANPELRSLKVWENSKDYTSSDEQLAKRLGKICVGLVEVKDRSIPLSLHTPGLTASKLTSLRAGAGSFESGRYVYVIHDSVREFFLNGPGFRVLNPTIQNPRGDGHLYLLQTCINYGYLEEMNVFRVKNRTRMTTSSNSSTTNSDKALVQRRQSHISFGSSASLALSINSCILSPELLAFRKHRLELFDNPTIGHHKAVELSANLLNRLDLPPRIDTQNPSAKTSDIPVEPRQLRFMFDITEVGSWIGTSRLKPLVPQQAWKGAEQVRSSPQVSPSLAPEVLSYDNEVTPDSSIPSTRASTIYLGPSGQPSVSTHHGSYIIIPEVPSLSHYVQDMLVYHAIAAEAESADPSLVLKWLFSRGWRSWAATREDMRGERSPLQLAARWNLISWLEWLDSIDWIRENPEEVCHSIVVAVRNGNKEALIFLLSRLRLNKDWTLGKAFHYAAALETSSILSLLCGTEKDSIKLTLLLNCPDSKDRIPLHIAARSSSISVVKMLLEKGPDPNALDVLGNNPLHAACNRNEQDIEVCRVLIDSGCDITVRNNIGLRPLDLARRNGFYEVVEYIQAQESKWTLEAAATSADSSIFAVYPSTRSSLSQ
jgi:hypothetical protein